MIKTLKQSGFTIVEFMIATSVFSVVLLVALAGFNGVGNIFYKGVAVNQTQSVNTQIMNDLRSNIQSASAISGPISANNGYTYYCIGNIRYTFNLSPATPLDGSSAETYGPGGNFGLLRDTLSGNGCADPCVNGNCQSGQAVFNNPQELLGNKMQLIRFDINPDPSISQLYNFYVNVAYGDPSDFANYHDQDNMACQGGLSAQKFCAVTRLATSVYEGLH